MYWGTGQAKIILTSDDNREITLPVTNDRNKQPYVLAADNRENPITKQTVQRIFGYRGVFRFFWIIAKEQEAKLRLLVSLANRANESMTLYPHEEIEHICYDVVVTDVRVGYSEKTTMINEIEIEFTAVYLVDEIPDYNIYLVDDGHSRVAIET